LEAVTDNNNNNNNNNSRSKLVSSQRMSKEERLEGAMLPSDSP
jgi:hypothetical protein